jgi:hypothetical protein
MVNCGHLAVLARQLKSKALVAIVWTVFSANPAKPALRAGLAGFAVLGGGDGVVFGASLPPPQPRLKESVRSIA